MPEHSDEAIAAEWARMQARGRVRSRRNLVANLVFAGIVVVGIAIGVALLVLLDDPTSPTFSRSIARGWKVFAYPIVFAAMIGAAVRKALLPRGQFKFPHVRRAWGAARCVLLRHGRRVGVPLRSRACLALTQ